MIKENTGKEKKMTIEQIINTTNLIGIIAIIITIGLIIVIFKMGLDIVDIKRDIRTIAKRFDEDNRK